MKMKTHSAVKAPRRMQGSEVPIDTPTHTFWSAPTSASEDGGAPSLCPQICTPADVQYKARIQLVALAVGKAR